MHLSLFTCILILYSARLDSTQRGRLQVRTRKLDYRRVLTNYLEVMHARHTSFSGRACTYSLFGLHRMS